MPRGRAARAQELAAECVAFAPPPDLTLSEWSERYYQLSAESSAQPGKWRCYPFQRGIMDAVTDPLNRKITVMKSARVGYTKTLNAAVGYHVHQDPCGMLVVQPTVEDAQGYSKDEIATMLRDCPEVGKLVRDSDTGSQETILHKSFPGGHLTLVGANSARGFRRITVRKVLFDEVDGYPPSAGEEGDQLLLGARRADTYWNSQIIYGSTPTISGLSRIESLYAESDQRKYFVPCPHCQHMHPLEWGRLSWKPPYTEDDPHFICPACGQGFGYHHHHDIIERGEWRAGADFRGHAGFHIWAAYSYSPSAVWSKLVAEWHRVLHSKDTRQIQTFVNTVRGETWKLDADVVPALPLQERAEDYGPETLPAAVLLVTCGVDVQADRLAVEVVAWGDKHESWSALHEEWYGDPMQVELWDRLDGLLSREFKRVDGKVLTLDGAAVDSGYNAKVVYAWTAPRITRRVWAVKGREGESTRLVGEPHKVGDGNAKMAWVNTFNAKDILYSRLKNKEPRTAGYCHFPKTHGTEYYEQLTAEQSRVVYKHGRPVRTWEPISAGRRNEALDCRVYAMAALDLLRPDWARLAKVRAPLVSGATEPEPPKEETPEETPEPAATVPAEVKQSFKSQLRNARVPHRPGRRGGFATNWG